MNKYETIYITNVNANINEVDEKFKGIIENNGGIIEKIDKLGIKKLAYEIRGQKEGNYTVIYFEGESELITELERQYRIEDDIIKFITIKSDEQW